MKRRLDSLDLLRGIAVLLVCLCHFGDALSDQNSVFQVFHKGGILGVYMFFVISGFVIPLSLHNGRFDISNYFTFLSKRISRLHLPYLLALAVTLAIMFFSAYLKGRAIPENASTIFQSLFYSHIPYNNPVFWTLIVEWQYYLFIGIFYCLLIKYPKFSVGMGISVLLFISHIQFLPSIHFFFFIAFFLVGVIGFLIYTKQGDGLLNRVVLAGLILFLFFFYGLTAAIISLLTILFILSYKKSIPKGWLFTGKISYSIYLLHYPVGVKFLMITLPIFSQQFLWSLFIITLFIIGLLSYLFYKWIEMPSENLAYKFRYEYKNKISLTLQHSIS